MFYLFCIYLFYFTYLIYLMIFPVHFLEWGERNWDLMLFSNYLALLSGLASPWPKVYVYGVLWWLVFLWDFMMIYVLLQLCRPHWDFVNKCCDAVGTCVDASVFQTQQCNSDDAIVVLLIAEKEENEEMSCPLRTPPAETHVFVFTIKANKEDRCHDV